MKSPLQISYQDLINSQESRVRWMEKNFPVMKIRGSITANKADHELECGRVMLRLLKKYQRERQGDLFETFEKMK